MTTSFNTLEQQLANLKQQNLYRERRIIESPQGIHLILQGKSVINFCSNDYLGLANDSTVKQAFQTAVNQYGVGSGSAHLICGHNHEHHALEEELAAFTKRERVLLFSTGYMANIGVISALMGRYDNIFEDRLNHASLIDGALLSRATLKRYNHINSEQLNSLLNNATGNKLIVTDGIFSMDGDNAPLDLLIPIAKQNGAWIMLDDAHGLGVIGEYGGGLLEQYQLTQHDVAILIGTLGKAFGTFGAFVAGSEVLIETLIQKARSYIYTTALPPAIASATRASLKIIQTELWRREKLNHLIHYFKVNAEQCGLKLMPSLSPIQPILMNSNQQALQMSQALLAQGFLVSAIRPPTVPQARLRLTFSALHETQHIDRLLDAFNKCGDFK